MPTTRGDLRRMVGERVGGLIVARTTAQGTTTTFQDYLRLTVPDGRLAGRIAYCSAGAPANVGQARPVVTNTQANAQVTVNPGFPVDIPANSIIELYRMNQQGPMPDEIDRAINDAIEEVKESAVIAVREQYSTIPNSGIIELPSDWNYVSAVRWKDELGQWHGVPPRDFDVDRIGRTVQLKNLALHNAFNRLVEVTGYMNAQPLTNDNQEVKIDVPWLRDRAASLVCNAVAMRVSEADRDRWDERSRERAAEAEVRLPSVATRIVGKCARLEAAS